MTLDWILFYPTTKEYRFFFIRMVNNQILMYIPKLKQSDNHNASKIKHNY